MIVLRVMIVGSLGGELGRAASMAASRGAALEQADTGTAALERLRSDGRFNLVLCEIGSGRDDKIEWLVTRLAAERIRIPVVACGRNVSPTHAADAIRAGAAEFLPLPPDLALVAAILEAASGAPDAFIARDPATLRLLKRAEQIAASDASVLVSGESGTGKEVLARRIHQKSKRSKGPFVAMNCAAIPDTLLESELFGHEKGAFSGALARRIGKFEAARGGTVLLDEISEMDVRLQAKLLRALQEREIDRLGGGSPVRIDVRVIATSNRDMQEEIAAGRFRADLFFRLNVVSLVIPPLRARPTDIPLLAEHYAAHYAEANDLPPRRLTEDALARLVAYDWPGNVRELENTMHRAVLLTESDVIGPSSLEIGRGSQAIQRASNGAPGDPGSIGILVGRSMSDVEQALIIETLRHTLGNRTHAANILGISIRALRNKLKDYARDGIDVPAPLSGVAA